EWGNGEQAMTAIGIVGTGFVADLYMRSLATYPQVAVTAAYDHSPTHAARFAARWPVPMMESLAALIDRIGPGGLILNLTNPAAHFEISHACLEASLHVYSEKPLAMQVDQARVLVDLAARNGLLIASAPCSALSEAAQTLGAALRSGTIGRPRLVYAELDDGYIPQAPYKDWLSESGAPWPAEDEFEVGCTLEHAGYYLTWLMMLFGPVTRLVAASACITGDEMPVTRPAPDFSTATLFFESGMVARLTCSIVAPHNHALRIITDTGTLELDEAWNNAAPVRFRRRFRLRRRLINAPVARRLRLPGPTHPKVGRWGAAAMNFALGPMEMLAALTENRPCRMSPDLALHLTEVTLAIQAGGTNGAAQMTTTFAPITPMPWAQKLRGL
ncbi:MAG: Gfo/Idh/MocA family protein, partial [Paracoccaceae bacterium]